MSLIGNIKTLFEDKAKTSPVFPITKIKAVSDDNGVGLGALLEEKSDVGHTHTAAEVGAKPSSWMPTAAEVGARPDTWLPTAADVSARPSNWMPTAAEVGAVTESEVSTMINNARYSPIKSVRSQDTPTYTITATDGGCTIRETNASSNGLQVVISSANSANIPTGTEIAFLNFANTSRTQLEFNGTRAAIAGEGILGGVNKTVTAQIAEYMGMIAIKKIATDATAGDIWLITGNMEVV
jgi:hypothetical protein